MFRSKALPNGTITVLLIGICLQAVLAPLSLAQDKCVYQRLQILVPGEEPAPFTETGKTGFPVAQTVGVPFQVRVRACNDDWETYHGVTHTIRITSTDGQADLPPDTPLNDGELTTWVTLNTEGAFTVTAEDMSDYEHKQDTSPAITVEGAVPDPIHLEISPIDHDQTAGQPAIITIETRRVDGSLDTSQAGPVDLFQLTSFGQGVLAPETVTLAGGQWTGNVTFFLADPADEPGGSVRLKAVMQDQDLQGLSNYFDVGPGPYARLLIITPGQNWTPWILDGISGVPDQQWADGPFDVDVYATDEYWNRVDVSDQVKLESGDSEADTPAFGNLNGGHRTFTISLRTPGEWFLAVSDMDQPEVGGFVSLDVPVFYSHLQILLPGEEAAPGTETGKIGQPQPQVAGVPFPVRIRACNADFEPVPTDRVVVRLTTTDHTATVPVAEPMLNGELVTELTFNASGTFTISAEDIIGPEYYTVTSPDVSVSGSTGMVSDLTIDTISTFQIAGQPTMVTIRATDANGDQVSTFGGAVGLEQWTSLDRGSLEPDQIDLVGGAWTGPVTFHLADESSVRLHAVSQQDPAIIGTSNEFQVAPGELSRLLIVLPGQYLMPATEGGLLGGPATQATGYPFIAEVVAADQFWNRVHADHTVRIESMDSNASTPVQAVLEDGHATMPITFGSVGNWTLTVHDVTDGTVAPMTTVPISVLGSTPAFVIDPLASPVTAGQSVPVTIHAHDPEGNLLDGYNGFAMLAADTGPETIQPATIQFTGGIWTGAVTFFGAAEQTAFSCVDFASPPNIGTSDPFQVLPGAFAGLQVLLPGQENVGGRDPGFTGEPVEQEAGLPFNMTVQAVDSWWNPVPDVDAAISLEPTDPFALAPRDTNLTNGFLNLEATFLRAGEHTMTAATDTVDIAGYTSDTFIVRPGPYGRIITLAPGEELLSGSELGKAGLAVDQSISYSFVIHTMATDNWWNPVGDVDDLIELICTDTLADLPQTFSLVDGEAEVVIRLSTAGYQLMTLNNLSNPEVQPAHTQVRAIESGFHIEAEIHPAEVVAGQPFTLSVRVVNDAGALMQAINSFANVVALNATTEEPGQGDLLVAGFQFHQGVRSMTQTYTRSEPIVLMVTSEMGEDPGLTNVLTVVPGDPAALDFHETATWVGGRKTTEVNAKVADELGNGIPDVPVEFNLTGDGSLEIINNITDAQGLAKARYTGTSQPGSDTIEVASAGFTNSMEIQTSLMDPGSSGGTISNYPNPFHPGDGVTTITYMLSGDAKVTMRLFTLSGTLVFKREYPAGVMGGAHGINEVEWDGSNGEGEYVASGGYILYVEAERLGETIHQIRRRIGVVR